MISLDCRFLIGDCSKCAKRTVVYSILSPNDKEPKSLCAFCVWSEFGPFVFKKFRPEDSKTFVSDEDKKKYLPRVQILDSRGRLIEHHVQHNAVA